MIPRFCAVAACLLAVLFAKACARQPVAADRPAAACLSHTPIREMPLAAGRPDKPGGPVFFVEPSAGDDAGDGSAERPWRTIGRALRQLRPDDTLYLRGGTYREGVRCSATGAAGKPITIRSHPGELAVIDGGFAEFYDAPEAAWEPCPGGAPGEYRSAREYRNLGDVAGMFGDSRIGLHTYWLLSDLRSQNETRDVNPETKVMDRAIYCGPGLWYDRQRGRIHVRLAHTRSASPHLANYQGETDPRRLPLVISPVESVPLTVECAQHVRFQDLVFRGGGQDTVVVRFSQVVEFDRVVIQCGSLRGSNSGPVRITDSAVHGRIPPWMWRIDSSKGCASGGDTRDIVRLLTPTLLETSHEQYLAVPAAVRNDLLAGAAPGARAPDWKGADGRKPQMTAWPHNHDWEVAHCEFTDGHDGVFLVGRNMRFHHNLVDNMQDDAVDISSATPERDDSMFIHQNLIRRCVTAISTHNYDYHVPRGVTSVFRNVIDMRQGVLWNRPTPDRPTGDLAAAFAFLMHGSDKAQFVESVRFYQNTVLCPTRGPYSFGHGSLTHLKPGSSRRVFNNIFIYLSPDPRQNVPYPLPFYGAGVKEADIQADGNLHWNPDPAAKPPADYLEKLRTHPLSEQNKKQYPPGLGANCLVADPKFVRLDVNPKVEADCRLQPGSPAIDQGVALPADWEDPLRPKAGRKPDIGALPHGLPPMTVGIRSR